MPSLINTRLSRADKKLEDRRRAKVTAMARKMLEPVLGERVIDQIFASGLVLRTCLDVAFQVSRGSRKRAEKIIKQWLFQPIPAAAPKKTKRAATASKKARR